ncbi:hypothetical protein [Streptomyces telluris]|uniref:Transcriptional regulator n=1 Tax=Streptomyces telluris TaxID=2720021 RepID=A0A9X2RQH6_9ACTN|nr:hypothetical protein [Streptomyces telluris]MCQ8774823.1 hypothetical protein [Streptomyces telluris]NJP82176.1 hypothetical protein [Streptomyces telluris]
MLRRSFVTASTGTVAAVAVPMLATQPAVGISDVRRLHKDVADLTVLDDQRGGHQAMEAAALAGARKALALQHKSAMDPIRGRLYSAAADCIGLAAWSCIDARDPEHAQQHLERAMTLAGLARDSGAQFRIWTFMSMLANQLGDYPQALAAAQASRSTGAARRDIRRPEWIAFYTRGELDGLTGVTLGLSGSRPQAEAHFHRCVSALRPDQHRNRALYLAYVATEQLAQGDAEEAVNTALKVVTLPAATAGRTSHLLREFTTILTTCAPRSTAARAWADRPLTATA